MMPFTRYISNVGGHGLAHSILRSDSDLQPAEAFRINSERVTTCVKQKAGQKNTMSSNNKLPPLVASTCGREWMPGLERHFQEKERDCTMLIYSAKHKVAGRVNSLTPCGAGL